MSCAEDFDTFTVGRDLTRGVSTLPRVHSVNGRIYIFEQQQTTVLDREGDMSVYNSEGELKPGATPPTPVLINSLQELQRFGAPRN
jgi:membrane-anchored protein YejM (alkaline phosphatase superfamily)